MKEEAGVMVQARMNCRTNLRAVVVLNIIAVLNVRYLRSHDWHELGMITTVLHWIKVTSSRIYFQDNDEGEHGLALCPTRTISLVEGIFISFRGSGLILRTLNLH
jgi:hypothetical protein